MPHYRANHGFDDNRLGRVKRDQQLELSEACAQPFVRAGLLRSVVTEADIATTLNPIPAAGTALSALPAAPVLPQTTVPKPKRGRKAKAAGQFSA